MSRHAYHNLRLETREAPPDPITLPRTREEALRVLQETAQQIENHAAEPMWRDNDGVPHGYAVVVPEHNDYYAMLVLLGVTGE